MENSKKLKILLLEDMPEDAHLVIRMLQKSGMDFSHERVDNEKDYIERIKKFSPDVVLSDHSLPQFNSMEAFNICKSLDPFIPFILVTGAVSEEFAVTCIKRGVDDYILKSNLTRLPIAINHAIDQKKLARSKKNSENALKRQNKTLTKINKELDNFAYNVSHNLRAPLASVIGLINIIKLEDQKNISQFSELISMMDYSVKKLDMTLVNILNYSRNSRLENKFEFVDIKALIEDCREEMQYMEGMQNIDVNLTINNTVPFYSDKYRMTVILHNLLSNAIKYHDPDKNNSWIKITVNISGENAKINFDDNGIGINNKQIQNIYKMFFRGTERSDGAGLGLYIVKEMVERLKGTINIDSVEDKGTSVQIEVPNLNPGH